MCVCMCVCVSYWDRECCCYIRSWEYKNIPCPQVSLGAREESAIYTKHKDTRAIIEIYTNYLLQFDFSGKQTVRWNTNLVFRMFMGIDCQWKARGDRQKMEKWAMCEASQSALTLSRALKVKGPMAVVLNWVETVRSFCFQLVSPGR